MTFTDYVHSLDASGEPPELGRFNEVMALLKKALIHEMKKRGLWTSPPRHLGVYGGDHWHGEIFEELLLDAYEFIFVRRLPGLKKNLLVNSNIDSLVFHNLRLCLHERQKHHDPLGYRTFEILQSALRQLIEARALHILEGNERKIRNNTLFGFTPWSSEDVDAAHDFASRVGRWNDELLPDLVDARGKARQKVTTRLAGFIARLQGDGIETFRFKDLVDPLKSDIRARWTPEILLSQAETVLPNLDFEIWQSFQKLRGCVVDKLTGSEESGKTRDYLQKLWLFLWSHAAELERIETQSKASGEPKLSDLALSRILEIPRDRIPGLKKTLGRLTLACRKALRAASPPSPVGEAREQRLRDETGAMAARFAEQHAATSGDGERPPKPGDVFLFTQVPTLAAEWVVLEQNSERLFLVVPTDNRPWVGSYDVAITVGAVRCRPATQLDAQAFEMQPRTGTLEPQLLERLRRKRKEIAAGTVAGSIFEQEIDADSEYQNWMQELSQAQASLPVPKEGEVVAFPRQGQDRPRRWHTPSSRLYSLAASILLVITLGFLGRQYLKVDSYQQRLDEVEQDLREKDDLVTGYQTRERELEDEVMRRQSEATILQSQLAEREERIAGLEREAAIPPPEPSMMLLVERTGDRTLALPEAAEFVVLYVDLEVDNDYPSYRATLKTKAGAHLWTSSDLPVRVSKWGSEAVARIPAGLLDEDDYELTLEGRAADGVVHVLYSYKFDVDRESR